MTTQMRADADDSLELSRKLNVAMINMPWAATDMPSIQCGLLKPALQRRGHTVDAFYFNLDLAATVGRDVYKPISDGGGGRSHLFGEWLFGTACYGTPGDVEGYFDAYPGLHATCARLGMTVDELRDFRDETLPKWIQEKVNATDWSTYNIIGFTSTFEQNVAALAMAKSIKSTYPESTIVMGGANFDGAMGREYIKRFKFIDFAVIGEGDKAFPDFADALADSRSPETIPGVCSRRNVSLIDETEADRVEIMDELPLPDYDDYFAQLSSLGEKAILGDDRLTLLYESSRGCWWGAKHHCTFCGLNSLGMTFRSKSPDQVVTDLETLSTRYGVKKIDAVDNILDMRYLRSTCAELSKGSLDLELFYEVKANLTRAQIESMAAAGICKVQPGIESLSTHVLGLMRKGSDMLTNIRMLKWAHFYGIEVAWNLLVGFPGETVEDYWRQTSNIFALRHLPPPGGVGPIWLERFSPYFFDDTLDLGEVAPTTGYGYAYPVEGLDLNEIAYFFDYSGAVTAGKHAHALLRAAADEWRAAWAEDEHPRLEHSCKTKGGLEIIDTRRGDERVHLLEGWRASAYEFCGDTAHSPSRVLEHLNSGGDSTVSAVELDDFLDWCDRELLTLEEDGRRLSLSVPIRE